MWQLEDLEHSFEWEKTNVSCDLNFSTNDRVCAIFVGTFNHIMEIIGARDMENSRPLFGRCWTNCRAQCRYITQFFNNNTGL